MPLTLAQLHYKYDWQADPGELLYKIGQSVNDLNRKDGYEVLNFIRTLMIENNWKNHATGEKIESMIHRCPLHFKLTEQIKTWIFDNWRYF